MVITAGDQSVASSLYRSSAGTPAGASGLTTSTLLRASRDSPRVALSSIRAGSPPWVGAPTTIVLAPTVLAYSATIRPAAP